MDSGFWLTNTLLETGYDRNNGRIISTEAGFFHLFINQGKISKVIPASESISDDLPQKDARGMLALPSFVEKHCHLDKTLLGDHWRAVTPVSNIFERFDNETNVLASLDTSIQERAEKLLNRYLAFGVTHVRSHIDVHPNAGLERLEAVQETLEGFEGKLSYETVAFPQHGLLRSNAKNLINEALHRGVDYVGGVDPATVDGDMEASLQQMVQLAVKGNAGIDLHLHEADHLGIHTMKRLAELTKEAGLQNKVAISHAYGLGDISLSEAEEMAALLADAGITVISSVPINRKFPPMGLLHEKGVKTAVGCDNIFDAWSPFGNGDVLEKASRLAEISGWTDEQTLSQTLKFMTDGKTPVSLEGERAWPSAGDDADIVLVDASCSAETIARRSERLMTMHKGKVVSDSLGSF